MRAPPNLARRAQSKMLDTQGSVLSSRVDSRAAAARFTAI
jgi:hypothetical protein